jgi:hypothetical protein
MKWLVFASAALLTHGQGRLRPPAQVGCDRNQLTAYEGVVRSYSRTATQVVVRIATDADTDERVVVKLGKGQKPESRFLWNGEAFDSSHWRGLEAKPGVLRRGMRVIAWVCEGGSPPLLDWRMPPGVKSGQAEQKPAR